MRAAVRAAWAAWLLCGCGAPQAAAPDEPHATEPTLAAPPPEVVRAIDFASLPTGHREIIWSVAYSADGQWLLTTSADGTVRRWAAGDLRELGRVERPITWSRGRKGGFEIHASIFAAAELGADLVVVGEAARGTSIDAWNAATGWRSIAPFPERPEDEVDELAQARDGSIFVRTLSGSVLRRAAGAAAWTEVHGPSETAYLAVAGDRLVELGGAWLRSRPLDGAAPPVELTIPEGAGALLGARAAPIVALGFADRMEIWSLATGKQQASIARTKDEDDLALSADGTLLALAGRVAGNATQLRIVRCATGAARTLDLGDEHEPVSALAFSPDHALVTVAHGAEDTLTSFRVADLQPVAASASKLETATALVAPTPDSLLVVAEQARLYLAGAVHKVGDGSVDPDEIAWLPSVGAVACQSPPRLYKYVLDAELRQVSSAELPPELGEVDVVAASPSGRLYVASAIGISRLDARTLAPELVVPVADLGAPALGLAVSRDEAWVAATGADAPRLFHGESGKMRDVGLVWPSKDRHPSMVMVDGGTLALRDRYFRLFAAPLGSAPVATEVPFDEPVSAIAAGQAGELLVGTAAGDIVRMELATGRVRARAHAHFGAVSALALEATSDRVVSAGAEGRVSFWSTGLERLGDAFLPPAFRDPGLVLVDAAGRPLGCGGAACQHPMAQGLRAEDGLPPLWTFARAARTPTPQPASGHLLLSARQSQPVHLTVAPSGAWLAVEDGADDVVVWDLHLGLQVHRTRSQAGAFFDGRGGLWSVRKIEGPYASEGDHEWVRWDPASDREEPVDFGSKVSRFVALAAMSGDGETLAWTTTAYASACPPDETLCVTFSDTAQRTSRSFGVARQRPADDALARLALDERGARLAVGYASGFVQVWDVAGARLTWQGQLLAHPLRELVLHPRLPILAGAWDDTLVVHDYQRDVALLRHREADTYYSPACLAFDRTGSSLFATAEAVVQWSLADPAAPPRRYTASGKLACGESDGQLVWGVGRAGDLHELDGPTGTELRVITSAAAAIDGIRDMTPDGAFVTKVGQVRWAFDPARPSRPRLIRSRASPPTRAARTSSANAPR